MKQFNVIAIYRTTGKLDSKCEKIIFCARDRFTACCMAMSKNIHSQSIAYIVESASGKRMSITKQRQYLSFAQTYKKGINNATN